MFCNIMDYDSFSRLSLILWSLIVDISTFWSFSFSHNEYDYHINMSVDINMSVMCQIHRISLHLHTMVPSYRPSYSICIHHADICIRFLSKEDSWVFNSGCALLTCKFSCLYFLVYLLMHFLPLERYFWRWRAACISNLYMCLSSCTNICRSSLLC